MTGEKTIEIKIKIPENSTEKPRQKQKKQDSKQ